MSVRSNHLKLVGAAGAAALTVGALAAPAQASTATVHYTCTTSLGPATPSAVYNVATAPATMAVGQPLATTATFTLDAATTALGLSLDWDKFKGTIKTRPTASKAGLDLRFPKTTLANGAGGSTDAQASGSTLAGTEVGPFTFKLGDLGRVVLTGFDASGDKVGTVVFPTSGSFGRCTNDDGTTTLMDGVTPVTTTLVKDKTTTKASADYKANKDVAVGKAKVKSHFGLKVTGKVKFTLKRGTHKIQTLSDRLNKKGIAKVHFEGVKKQGRYSITAKYGGSANMKRSSDKATFTVG